MKSLFKVNGKPFFSIGGQVNNSSSSNPEIMKMAFMTAKGLGLNTIAAPVHWELFEPVEGAFDYSQVKMLIEGARATGLKLVILWFGSWKNGNSHYVPSWIKLDKKRFLWAKSADGVEIRSLSPISKETLEADKKAFVNLCKFIKENNNDETVIAVQVENEPGLIGSPRDYSPEANELFNAKVPEEVATFANKNGTWEKVFGFYAAEYFSAYYFVKYIDEITAKGKEVLDLPMYINVWLGEMYSHIPGTNYPAGGATTRAFPLWKYFAKHIDAISPDIYLLDYATTEELFKTYSSLNNTFYLPESMPSPLLITHSMRAVANYGLCGIHFFGIDMFAALFNPDLKEILTTLKDDPMMKKLLPMAQEIAGSIKILANSKHLIEEYQGTGKLYAVGQYEGEANAYIDFGDYIGSIRFLNPPKEAFGITSETNMDNRHMAGQYANYRAKGFIVYKGNGEFYLTGDAYRLMLFPKFNIVETTSAVHAGDFLNMRSQGYVSVTEGFFNDDGTYVPTIIRNGDEYDYGLWVTSDIGVLHVKMDR